LMVLVFASTPERCPSFVLCARPSLIRGRSISLFVFSLLGPFDLALSSHLRPFPFVRSFPRFHAFVPSYLRTYSFVFPFRSLFATRSSAHKIRRTHHLPETMHACDGHVLLSMHSSQAVLQGSSQCFTVLPSLGSPTSVPIAPLDKATTVSVTSGPESHRVFCDDVALECDDDD
jgi:hypothetical protein